ncbi:hypothetical protein Taro_035744 [Colocasia esculenta]|uniref:Uncharacterized protein n=1 Tax=Colocasia esculenta TaxID=4460 RepID=A0A843W7L5_COLES|nr:hypothetical protein [Colocasia esculenta]
MENALHHAMGIAALVSMRGEASGTAAKNDTEMTKGQGVLLFGNGLGRTEIGNACATKLGCVPAFGSSHLGAQLRAALESFAENWKGKPSTYVENLTKQNSKHAQHIIFEAITEEGQHIEEPFRARRAAVLRRHSRARSRTPIMSGSRSRVASRVTLKLRNRIASIPPKREVRSANANDIVVSVHHSSADAIDIVVSVYSSVDAGLRTDKGCCGCRFAKSPRYQITEREKYRSYRVDAVVKTSVGAAATNANNNGYGVGAT